MFIYTLGPISQSLIINEKYIHLKAYYHGFTGL